MDKKFCKFGETCFHPDCKFEHPPGRANPSEKEGSHIKKTRGECKFGDKCTREDCIFTHPKDSSQKEGSHIKKSRGECKFGDKCSREDCKFTHPKDSLNKPERYIPAHHQRPKKIKKEKDFEETTEAKDEEGSKKHQRHAQQKKEQEEIKNEDQEEASQSSKKQRRPKKEKEWEELKNEGNEISYQKKTDTKSKIREESSLGEEKSEETNPEQINCLLEEKCADFYCIDKHPKRRTKTCQNGLQCRKPNCVFLHPEERKGICALGKSCREYDCDLLHPPGRPRLCRKNENCVNPTCNSLHPSKRKENCKDFDSCEIYECPLLHSFKRKKPCGRGINCRKENCEKLHPPKPASCEKGMFCIEYECKFDHPPERIQVCHYLRCKNAFCEYLHPPQWNPSSFIEEGSKVKNLRTLKERTEFREINKLPILAYKEELIAQLKKDMVLVITGPSGIGKSTQIPQYLAEEFPGLIVCCNPCPMATVALAQKIAVEYDNTSVGENVSYKVEGGKSVKGKKIQVVTDSNFVRSLASKDPTLKAINVLMIDEAERRGLNTDLAIGIAKTVRDKRPDDFYVVVISSERESKGILELFLGNNSTTKSVNIPDNSFIPIEEENPREDPTNLEYLIPFVIDARKKYREGNCLVFLPGALEINEAIKEMKRQSKDKYECVPFFASLSAEDLSYVLSPSPEKTKIIFCTELAESAFRIPNVQLVIDTGICKSANYDPKRRLTINEQVYISKEQRSKRMACAGSFKNGVYISFYSLQCLTQERDPKILRSSLDSIVLQLKIMGYDPMGFPFLTKPNQEALWSSYDLLKEFGCIDESLNQEITPKGRLFASLPFDIRMSNFVSMGHEIYNEAENFAILVALLSSPVF